MKVPSHTISGSLILPDTITSMYGHAIEENHKITYLKIPAGYVSSLTRFVGMDNLRALEHIDVDEENAKYKAVNGVLYNKESTIVLLYPPCKRDQSFELMPCVKFLDEDSFLNVKYLKNFSFNQNEIELKDGQFDSMELTSINHITTREEYNALDNDIKSNIQNNLYSLEGQPIITSLVEQEIDYAIATYLDESNMTIYEKIKALYDYAVDKVEYDHEDMQNDNNHCPSSLFLRDKTVCEGYALAMKLLLDKAGIRNEMLITDPSNKAGHAWNIVNIDGNWLHIDATWDDEDDGTLGADITYFLKTTEEYAKLHHRVDYHVENDRFGDYSWAVVDPSLHNTKPECNMLFGDLDADGVLTIKDVLSMRDEIRAFGNYSYMNYYNITADMNRDGAINMSDYNILNNIVSSQTAE